MALPIFDIDGMLVKHNGYKIVKAWYPASK